MNTPTMLYAACWLKSKVFFRSGGGGGGGLGLLFLNFLDPPLRTAFSETKRNVRDIEVYVR